MIEPRPDELLWQRWQQDNETLRAAMVRGPETRRRTRAGSIWGRKWKTWPYDDGKAQNLYVWLKGWTIHIAIIRQVKP